LSAKSKNKISIQRFYFQDSKKQYW